MDSAKAKTNTNAKERRNAKRAAKAKAAAEATRAAEAAAEAARAAKASAKSKAVEASIDIDIDECVLDTIDDPEKFGKLVHKKTAKQISETEGCKWYRFFDPQTGEHFPKEPVNKPVKKLSQVISKNLEAPEPQIKEFAEYPDGVVPGSSIPLMYILGFLAVVFKNDEMSVGELIDSITEMVGFPVEVYSLGKGNIYIICFKSSIKDLFAAVNASYRARHNSKIAIRTYQSDRFREGTRCFPLFHPEDPIFQDNKRKMKTIPEEVEASTNSFAALRL